MGSDGATAMGRANPQFSTFRLARDRVWWPTWCSTTKSDSGWRTPTLRWLVGAARLLHSLPVTRRRPGAGPKVAVSRGSACGLRADQRIAALARLADRHAGGLLLPQRQSQRAGGAGAAPPRPCAVLEPGRWPRPVAGSRRLPRDRRARQSQCRHHQRRPHRLRRDRDLSSLARSPYWGHPWIDRRTECLYARCLKALS